MVIGHRYDREMKSAMDKFEHALKTAPANYSQKKKTLLEIGTHVVSFRNLVNKGFESDLTVSRFAAAYRFLIRNIRAVIMQKKLLEEDKKKLNDIHNVNPEIYEAFEDFFEMVKTFSGLLEDYKELFELEYKRAGGDRDFETIENFLDGWYQKQVDEHPDSKVSIRLRTFHEKLKKAVASIVDAAPLIGVFQKELITYA